MVDSPSASAFAQWANSSAPGASEIFMDFAVYNITNVTELINGGKPFLQEVCRGSLVVWGRGGRGAVAHTLPP